MRRNGRNWKADSHHAVTMQKSNPGLLQLHQYSTTGLWPPAPHSLLYVLHKTGYFIVGEFCIACMRYIVFSWIISLALAWLQDCVLFSGKFSFWREMWLDSTCIIHSTDTNLKMIQWYYNEHWFCITLWDSLRFNLLNVWCHVTENSTMFCKTIQFYCSPAYTHKTEL